MLKRFARSELVGVVAAGVVVDVVGRPGEPRAEGVDQSLEAREQRFVGRVDLAQSLARRLPQLECRHSTAGPSMICANDVDGAIVHAKAIAHAPSA